MEVNVKRRYPCLAIIHVDLHYISSPLKKIMFIYFYNLLFPSVSQGSSRKQAVYSSGVTEYKEEVLHGSVDRVGGPQKKVPSELTTLPTPKPQEATRGAART